MVEDQLYIVDCGSGIGRQVEKAGLLGSNGRNDLRHLRAVFITHLHSDHVAGFSSLLLEATAAGGFGRPDQLVRIFGPGRRGALPNTFPPGRPAPTEIAPDLPFPGTEDMVGLLMAAFATDLNDRTFDTGVPSPALTVRSRDIALPPGCDLSPGNGESLMVPPFKVYEDGLVRVSATLVDHGQMFPAFAFRFDTDDGSVTFSGDTTVSENLIALAEGSDVLVHEVLDRGWVEESIAQLQVSPETKEAYLNHMLGAHTHTQQVGLVAEGAGAATLVLNHFVPANLPDEKWLGAGENYGGRLIVARDLQVVGIGRGSGLGA